jgi:hypothetical protein
MCDQFMKSRIRGQTGSVHGTLEIIQKGKSPVCNIFNQTQEGLSVVSVLC